MTQKLSTGFVSHCFCYIPKKHNGHYATFSAITPKNNRNLVNPPVSAHAGGGKKNIYPYTPPSELTHD